MYITFDYQVVNILQICIKLKISDNNINFIKSVFVLMQYKHQMQTLMTFYRIGLGNKIKNGLVTLIFIFI